MPTDTIAPLMWGVIAALIGIGFFAAANTLINGKGDFVETVTNTPLVELADSSK